MSRPAALAGGLLWCLAVFFFERRADILNFQAEDLLAFPDQRDPLLATPCLGVVRPGIDQV